MFREQQIHVIKQLIVWFLTLGVLYAPIAIGQKKRNDLEREKKENLKRLEETNKILEETKQRRETSVGQLQAISQQIKQKSRTIVLLEREIEVLDQEVVDIEKGIEYQSKLLQTLKEEYSRMLYEAQKVHDSQNKLVFLFSSSTFNQLVMRLIYFKQYSELRRKQAMQINKATQKLQNKKKLLVQKKIQKSNVLMSIRTERENLSALKNTQENTIQELARKENELFAEIEQQKKNLQKLEKLITELIRKEMERAAQEAKAKDQAQAKATHSTYKTPEGKLSNGGFGQNRGRLAWPVEHGFISQQFGKQPHPVLQHVTIENLGVDIQTKKNETIRSVYEGTITAIAEVPGMHTVVMIQHGEYYTFYAKLKSVSVKNGQKVKAMESIGIINTSEEEVSELQFQIWKGNEKLNPEDWLIRK